MSGGSLLRAGGGGIDYSKQYLTFSANSACQVSFAGTTPSGGSLNTLQYSLDSGKTWTTLSNKTYLSLASGNSIMFKGNCISSSQGIGTFASTGGKFNASGNIMSLLFGDNFKEQTDLTGYNNAFSKLFFICKGIVSAENLILPATALASFCYSSMFDSCASLTTAPSVLPATTLARSCYSGMFRFCSSFTTAPQLPATTLGQSCYLGMFRGCTSLVTAPELPATTLANWCYVDMFRDCGKLNYIKAMFISTPGESTSSWVSGVAASGTFVKNSSATWDVTGENGIPSGWTVQNA